MTMKMFLMTAGGLAGFIYRSARDYSSLFRRALRPSDTHRWRHLGARSMSGLSDWIHGVFRHPRRRELIHPDRRTRAVQPMLVFAVVYKDHRGPSMADLARWANETGENL